LKLAGGKGEENMIKRGEKEDDREEREKERK
jgi:hypothetical protein